jgi:PAS domain S-box-containing protein
MEQELGNGWSEGISPEDLDRCLRTYESAFEARRPFQMEYRLRRADGVYRWLSDNGVPTYQSDGRFSGYIGSCVDISDHKDAMNRLRDSQERYAMASVAGAVGIWDWNFETNELYVDPTLKSILGFEEAEITRRPDDWGSRVHPEDVPLAAARIQACIDGATDVYDVEHRMLHKDGSSRWFLSRGSAIRGADGAVRRMVGTKVEITERKRAEEEIRTREAVLQESHREIRHLAGSLITAQDAERARIGRDLHDDVNQQLAALSIALSGFKRRLGTMPEDEDLQTSLFSIQGRVAALVESVRSLSHDLHPDVLKYGGLTAALSAHCAGIARTQIIAVTCTAEGDFESVHPKAAFCLYRIAQEALHNVVKHSNATQAEVRLIRTDDNLELTVADNGQGFDVIEARKSGRGLGLLSISERVRLARGTLSLMAELRKGTQVRVRLPVDWREAQVGDVSGQYQVI